MIFGKFWRKENYQLSNSIFEIDFVPSEKSKIIACKFLATQSYFQRQILGEKLLKNLSNEAKIPHVRLKISDTKQWSKKRNGKTVFKLYGYYRPKSSYIYIQNLTSVFGKTIAPKTFLNTLIHEWLHHYDTQKLKLYSIHTKGFYARLASLKNLLGLKTVTRSNVFFKRFL